MTDFQVSHLRHQGTTEYSLAIETRGRAFDLFSGHDDARIVFYGVSPDEMLALADGIIQIAFRIRDREEQDAYARSTLAQGGTTNDNEDPTTESVDAVLRHRPWQVC